MMKIVVLLASLLVVSSKVVMIMEDTVQSPCEDELKSICGLAYPLSTQEIFDGRMCLWANKDLLLPDCKTYLLHEAPSIVEPCYAEIPKYCKGVKPGDNRLHSCLSDRVNEVSSLCKQALEQDSMENNWRSFQKKTIDAEEDRTEIAGTGSDDEENDDFDEEGSDMVMQFFNEVSERLNVLISFIANHEQKSEPTTQAVSTPQEEAETGNRALRRREVAPVAPIAMDSSMIDGDDKMDDKLNIESAQYLSLVDFSTSNVKPTTESAWNRSPDSGRDVFEFIANLISSPKQQS